MSFSNVATYIPTQASEKSNLYNNITKRPAKTQKRSIKQLDDSKVKDALRQIHGDGDDEEDSGMGNFITQDFNPPSYPTPSSKEDDGNIVAFSNATDTNNVNEAHMTPAQAQSYYRNMNVRALRKSPMEEPIAALPTTKEYDEMRNKLNYIVNLLEEQKDERTNNVTEDVVLYSFLGVFVIFVVDSFARVGKYTR